MSEVLFCPFCREPFEGLTECPEHKVTLVPITALGEADARRIPDEDAKLATHDLRFGRGIVLAGALLTWVAVSLPVVQDEFQGGATTTGFMLWSLRADYLSVVPGAALVCVFTVFARDSRASLRRARVALGIAVAIAAVAVGIAAHHVRNYAIDSAAAGMHGSVSPGLGAYVVALGLALLVIGVTRLGGAGKRG